MPHLSEERLRELAQQEMERLETPGGKAGGSGHLSELTCALESVEHPVRTREGWSVRFTYRVEVITEFTYYPDNPPHSYQKEAVLILDEDGQPMG